MVSMTRFTLTLLLLFCSINVLAHDYTHGHEALQLFDEQGFANAPAWVRGWIMFMGLTFLSGLLFIKNHAIARWVVGGFVLGVIFVTGLAPLFDIPLLSGFIALCHLIFWSPGLYFLLTQRPFMGSKTPFALWSGVMTGVILFSFIFDIRDAALYLLHFVG